MVKDSTEGIVVAQVADRVRVRLYRTGTCENCNCILSTACSPEEVEQRRGMLGELFRQTAILEIEALNEAGALPGDRILLQVHSGKALVKASALLYLLPAAMFLVGLFAGGWWGQRYLGLSGDAVVLAQLGAGLGLMLLSLLAASLYAKLRERSEFAPIATKVLFRAADLR